MGFGGASARHVVLIRRIFRLRSTASILIFRFGTDRTETDGFVMLRILHKTSVTVVAIGSVLLATPVVRGDGRFDEIKRLYTATASRPENVSYAYTVQGVFGNRTCQYARRGELFRHAAVIASDGGFSMPSECVWDGTTAYLRPSYRLMTVSPSREHAKPSYPTPEMQLKGYLAGILDQSTINPAAQYAFSKILSEDDGSAVIEFHSTVSDRTLTAWLSNDFDYLPMRISLRNNKGVLAEIRDVQVVRVIEKGASCVVPISLSVWGKSRQSSELVEIEKDSVDLATLKAGADVATIQPLKPWPSEEVVDFESGVTTQKPDPLWRNDGRIGFPFADFAAGVDRYEQALGKANH